MVSLQLQVTALTAQCAQLGKQHYSQELELNKRDSAIAVLREKLRAKMYDQL